MNLHGATGVHYGVFAHRKEFEGLLEKFSDPVTYIVVPSHNKDDFFTVECTGNG